MVASNHRHATSILSHRCKKCDYSTLERLAGFWDEKPDPPAKASTLKRVKEGIATFLFGEVDEQRALAKVRKAQNKILPDNPNALICPRCYAISEGKERERALDLVIFSVLLLPLLQALVCYLGITFNNDVHQQFAMPGINDGIIFTFFFGSGAQSFFAVLLGGLALNASLLSFQICRRLLILEGLIGCLCFSLLLKNNWNFQLNHCTPYDGCDLTSPIAFDFMYCVLFGLPLFWCFILTCVALLTRDKPRK